MDINEFYKVNHLSGIGHRPGFSTLHMMAKKLNGSGANIADIWVRYMENSSGSDKNPSSPLKYLVLLEDVVGSGTQCLSSVQWAVDNLEPPILFIPLILCPNGAKALRSAEGISCGKLTVRPIIELQRSDLLGTERQGVEGWGISERVEELAKNTTNLVFPGEEPFGYENTGCSIATFSNTPNNTLPIVHKKSSLGKWDPLFPRVYRD